MVLLVEIENLQQIGEEGVFCPKERVFFCLTLGLILIRVWLILIGPNLSNFELKEQLH